MSAPLPPRFDSTLANVIAIGSACMLAGIGAQIAVLCVLFFVQVETPEDQQLFRIAIAIAGAAAGAVAVGPGVAVHGDRFTSPALGPEQRELVTQALANLDAADVQFSGLHAYRSDPHALSEHAVAAFAAVTACASGFKPLLPDADARFRHPGDCAPLPYLHPVPGALEQACAAYRDAAMILMLRSGKDPAAPEYTREVAERLGAVGVEPEPVADAAVREARRQRNLAAAAAGFEHHPYVA